MVRISDIVGALLRGVTMARIQADIFSNQASLQYLKDENLKNYPVPRAEIRQADINMKLTVLETVQKNVDVYALGLDTMTLALPDYVNTLCAIPVKPSSGSLDTDKKPLLEYFGAQAATILEEIRANLEAYLVQNITTAYDELMSSPKTFGTKTWRNESLNVLTTVLSAHQITVYLGGTEFSKALQTEATLYADQAHVAATFAVDMASTAFFDLDLAVKKDQILQLPEHVISEMRLSVVIENYEWASIKDKQGNIINKLTHK